MSWERIEFGQAPLEIIDGDRGKNYPKQNEFLENGYCLFLSATNVTRNGFSFENCQYITQEKHDALRKGTVDRGDIILTTRGTLGNVAYYSDNVNFENMRINSGMVTIKADPDFLLSSYLYYFVKSDIFQSQVLGLQSGAAQPQIPIRDIKKIALNYPDLPTQKQIAAILSAYDDLIENNRRRIALLEQAARLLYREWFVHFRFPGHETAKFVDGLPEGWSQIALGTKSDIRKGKNITKATINPGSIPVVAGGLRPAYFHDNANVKGPVITISASGANAGYIGLYFQDIWASDCSFISVSNNPHLFFVYQVMLENRPRIHAMQKGAAQPHVYPKDIQRLVVTWPIDELINQFLWRLKPMYHQVEMLEKQKENLTKARDLLLPRLMDGRIPV